MRTIVENICRSKRAKNIEPALATELELRHELTRRGVAYSTESYMMMLAELESQPDVIVHRLLRYKGYEINENTVINYADITES
jgi:hypothetical protein